MAIPAVNTCARFLINDRVWYVFGDWFKTHFTISVSDGAQAWEGQVSADEVLRRANHWDWPPLKYVDAAVEHLREQQEEQKASYQLMEKDANTLQLAWEMKQAGEEGVPLRGVVNLEKTDDPGAVVRLMMDYMHKKRAQLEMELSRKTRAFRNMKEEADKCANQARGFAEEKTHLEADLYKKFAAVLNAKKAKIRELKSQVGDGRSLAIVPAAEETDEGEGTENEASGAEDEPELEDERNKDPGGSTGRSDEGRVGQEEAARMDGVRGTVKKEEESELTANGGLRNGVKEDELEDRGKKEKSREDKRMEEEDTKPRVSSASALLGGGSTYTSGPRKRRR